MQEEIYRQLRLLIPDDVAFTQILAKHHPETNINIEIHSQFAPFTLNLFEEGFFQRHPSPPGDGFRVQRAQAPVRDVVTGSSLDPWLGGE